MRLAYFGSGSFGVPTLSALAREHRLTAIITQPDRPAGRGGRITPTPIAEWASVNAPEVPLLKPESIREAAVIDDLRRRIAPGSVPAVDAWVVIAYGQKLPAALLSGACAINLHASLLPRWRGAAPINAAILSGDTETGNSVITLADRMDAGLILAQSRRSIEPLLTAGELHDLLSADGPALISRVLSDLAAGSMHGAPQDESLATRAPKLSKADDWLDLTDSAEHCRRRVHALSPWPGISAAIGGVSIRIGRVTPVDADPQQVEAGTFIDPVRGIVRCGQNSALQLLEVQPAGKRMMPWPDFARGAGRALAQGSPMTTNRRPAPCN